MHEKRQKIEFLDLKTFFLAEFSSTDNRCAQKSLVERGSLILTLEKHLPIGWWTVVCHALDQEVGWRSKIFTHIKININIQYIQYTFCFIFRIILYNIQEWWNRWRRLQFETQPVRRKAEDRRRCFPYLRALWPPSSCVGIRNMKLRWFLCCRIHIMIMIVSMIWSVLVINISWPQTSRL